MVSCFVLLCVRAFVCLWLVSLQAAAWRHAGPLYLTQAALLALLLYQHGGPKRWCQTYCAAASCIRLGQWPGREFELGTHGRSTIACMMRARPSPNTFGPGR